MKLLNTIHRLHQLATELFAEACHRDSKNALADLTVRQFAVLAAISDMPGASQTDIVERTGIDRSTLADLCRRLQRKGLIGRRRTKQDARAYALQITDLGRRILFLAEGAAEVAERKLRKRVDGLDALCVHTPEPVPQDRATARPPVAATGSLSR